MDLAQIVLIVMWAGVTLYALLAGADFGAGAWDLLAGRSREGMPRREFIERAIGPVWEANHVWLIFVLVVLWTGFSGVFAAVMSTLYIPLTLAALGIIARGTAFAFRKAARKLWQQRLFGGAFALSSVLTPYFFGAVAGGIASGRVPPGLARGSIFTSWLNPTSALGGVLAVLVCVYLAGAYLCGDATQGGRPDLAEWFRVRALAAAAVIGVVALGGIAILWWDARPLYEGLTHRALPVLLASVVFGAASLVLLWYRLYSLVRAAAMLGVITILWGWPLAQYPVMLPPALTYRQAAAEMSVLAATIIVIAVGVLLIVPSMAWLISVQRRGLRGGEPPP
ncbi:cytochrome D ubiquinol oxidase subunit II [Sphaerisporangium siamense]|uniref:Cytochrome d ubiquinol oxidase subunit II n=1 Tax=Sphaerisporangium siamense TaxID=795645 RepID=A0A7W7GB82_9ACTN|nr:cytochrome d ubiquinol oxidase subunit II [Sphaerisporangium siamense]MBB4703192.1 cytochrome d ubiquinol oxidase subunit II [Sphaerisporangium siamense]GII89213.1 cytochrome D ubiquinol oxidase subunit II [Sphaerisporangium siamense]